MQATEKADKPGYTRVEIRGIVRADNSPCYHVPGDCRSKTNDLYHCGRCCWGVDKMFSSDSCDNNEDKEEEKPGAILVPRED
jgi:hypothetical protein